ncbi:GGDEF domain-containing protein [Meiothermus sp. QL-1]|nr:GGDEF domain-containing protein [Meiothermus sp. QL-1]
MTRHNLDPYATLEVADPLEGLRLRVTLWLLPMGAAAALAAWGFSVAAGKLNLLDRWLLWPLALCFLLLEIYLLRNPERIRQVWQLALVLIGVYELGAVYYEASHFLHRRDGISPALLWFPVVYLMAFVLLRRRQALYFSLGYLGLGVLLGGLGLLQSPQINHTALNTTLQFVLSNLAFLMLLFVLAYLRRYYAQMHQMAHTDALTGLLNRRGMQEVLELELERARRYGQPLALLLADIDRFKLVNDTYGHSVGDQVLREVAARLQRHLRENDVLARWGGEEFLLLAPGTDLPQAQRLAQRLLEVVRQSPLTGVSVTLSIGVAAYRPGDTPAALLSRADEAMYRAKGGGRDQVVAEEGEEFLPRGLEG